MSSVGYPDYQRITQWLGAPLVQGTGLVIGAGTHVDGPLEVANFASVIVALKATGGNVTVTLKQTVPGGPAGLVLTESVIVPAGATLFEVFVLFGQAVELDLTGSIAGTSVDYALYGSNTTTNAQVITAAAINFQHNDVLVAAEPTIDLEDVVGFAWSLVDDGPGTRVKVSPPQIVRGIVSAAGTILSGSGFTVAHPGAGQYTVTFAAAFPSIPIVVVNSEETTPVGTPAVAWLASSVAAGSFKLFTGSGADTGFAFIAMA